MVTAAAPINAIATSCGDAWAPPRHSSTSRFLESHFELSDEVEGGGGRFNLDDNPFWREVIDAVHDPFVESLAVQKSTQVGGTLTNIAMALATSVIDPAPSMFVVPTRDDGRLLRDRIYGNAEASDPILADRIPPVRLRNMISVDLETMHIYLAWPGSKQRMRGKPCKYVWLSEIDVYEFDDDAGDPNNAAERRTDRFPESTIVRESTPVGEDSPIARYFDAGDMRRWHCQCPHCDTYQPLQFFVRKKGSKQGNGGIVGYLDADGNHVDQDTARRQAYYRCINGCKITQPYKAAFIRSGVWAPHGCKVNKRGKVTGQPLKSPRRRSYHLWQILNPKKTFGDLAATYLHHIDEGNVREFHQDVLGLRYRSAKSMPLWHELGTRLAWPNRRGIVPAEAWFLTAAADVQGDRTYYQVRGWAPRRTSWLVDFGEFIRHETQHEEADDIAAVDLILRNDLQQLDGILDRFYQVDGVNPLGRQRLPVRLLAVDSNYCPADVHEYTRYHPEKKRLRLIRGDHHVTAKERYRKTEVARDPETGERVDDEQYMQDLWGIQVNYYKQLLIDRLQATPATGFPENKAPRIVPGGFYLTADILQTGEKYLKQLVNEPLTSVTDKTTGRKKTVFKPRSKKIGVDYWDTTVYSEAMADMVVGKMGWSQAAWIRWQKTIEKKRSQSKTGKRPRNILER